MADIPGHFAQSAVTVLGSQIPGAGGWSFAGAVGGVGRCLFCEGVRHKFSRPPAHAGRGRRKRDRQPLARRNVFPVGPVSCGWRVAGHFHRRARAGDKRAAWREHAAPGRS